VEKGGKMLWIRGGSDNVSNIQKSKQSIDTGPSTRVEISLKTGDIVIELYASSNIQELLDGLQKIHGFSDKMKKKLETLCAENKP
jgi:hypothetical protein